MSQIQTTELAPDLKICRIINGMWQVAGGHGVIDPEMAMSEMKKFHDAGFTTWDMADIYGPAELFYGKFHQNKNDDSTAFTKFVPNPGHYVKKHSRVLH